MRLLGRPSNSTHILGGRSATGLGHNGRTQGTISLHLIYASPGKHRSAMPTSHSLSSRCRPQNGLLELLSQNNFCQITPVVELAKVPQPGP